MPVGKCQSGGKSGFKWGSTGKCYTGPGAQKKAHIQGYAIEKTGWTEAKRKGKKRAYNK